MSDLISRQAAIDALDEQIKLCDKALGSFNISMKDEYAIKVERASLKAYRKTLEYLSSAQPEIHFDEWCVGCKEYDHDKHCCPRFNKVIRRTVEELKEQPKTGKWIEHNPHKFGLGIVFECSECGEKIECEEYNYCPNCGCHMLEEGD